MRKYLPILLLLLLCAGKASAQVPTLDNSCVAKIGTNQNFCTMSGVTANDAIIVHLYLGTLTFSSLLDCSGSTACTSTTVDTLTPSISCTVLFGVNVCEYYICASALSGTVSVTVNTTGSAQSNYIEAEAWKGMLPSGCLDKTGTNTLNTAGTSLLVNTVGNIGYPGEVVIGFVQVSATPSSGTGYSAIRALDNLQTQSSNSSPSVGVPASTSWNFANATGRGMISSWKGGIFVDSHSAGQNCGNVSSCAWNHTVGTGPNPMLWVVFTESTGFNNPTVTSVTAGGVGMNLAKNITSGSGLMQVRAYYLTAAGGLPTGTISIVITLSAAVGTTGGFYAGSQSFFGVAQANPFDAATITNTAASGTTYSASITTATSGAYVIDGFTDNSGAGAASANSPQVTSWTAGASSRNAGSSYQGPVITPGATTSSWADGTNTGAWAIIVGALKPAGSVAAASVAQNMVPMVI